MRWNIKSYWQHYGFQISLVVELVCCLDGNQCELLWTFQEGAFRTFQLNIVLLKCFYSDLVKLIVLVGVKAYLKPLKLYLNHCFNLIKKTILNGIVFKIWGIRFKCYEPWLYKHNFTEKCSHLLFTNLWNRGVLSDSSDIQ